MLPAGGSLLIALLKYARTASIWAVLSEVQTEADNGRSDHLHCGSTAQGGCA